MTRELRAKKFMKIISLAPEVLPPWSVKLKIRKGDRVKVIAGRDKGRGRRAARAADREARGRVRA